MAKPYDYILAGGGLAGLSLAYEMLRQGLLSDARLLLVDKEHKTGNDRTWCFWSKDFSLHSDIVTHTWSHLSFGDTWGQLEQRIAPYRYHLIRSADLYAKLHRELSASARVDFRKGYIQAIGEDEISAYICIDDDRLRATKVFSSCFDPAQLQRPTRSYDLYQHFMGYWIDTTSPQFDTNRATLMDFNTDQHGDARFMYVLPVSPTTALVEYTIFSANLLARETYEGALRQYIDRDLGIKDYSIRETETGVIPMTNARFPKSPHKNVHYIGTPSGMVKPTTGYAFLNILEQCRTVVSQLQRGKAPAPERDRSGRFAFYDTLLLHILSTEGHWARPIFSALFRRNRLQRILRFLDERTHLLSEIRIFASLPVVPFLRAVYKHYLQPGRADKKWIGQVKEL